MPSSRPTRSPTARASLTQSSIVTPSRGTNGHTSVAPMRGCAPVCRRMSMTSAARLMARNAASATAAGEPTKVTTVRLVSAPGSTSSSRTPAVDSITCVIASILSRSRPSEKFGTHSTSWAMSGQPPVIELHSAYVEALIEALCSFSCPMVEVRGLPWWCVSSLLPRLARAHTCGRPHGRSQISPKRDLLLAALIGYS